MKPKKAFLLVQEGGSYDELYIHVHETKTKAKADRKSCAKASYRTSDIIEVSAALDAHGEALYELLENVLNASRNVCYP